MQPAALHDWISQEEFDYYVKDFEAHGWNGGLNWCVVWSAITPSRGRNPPPAMIHDI